jgi:ATP-dependent exoDNAse (exonuclease V) beta subunit
VGQSTITVFDLEKAFLKNDIAKVMGIIINLFKSLPSEFFKEGKAVGESFYHGVIFLIFKILGVTMQAEVSAQQGRIDAVVETDTHIYIFEFKKNRKASIALEQIYDREYMEHFALSKKEIFLIGVAFNLQKRGVSDWVMEKFEYFN